MAEKGGMGGIILEGTRFEGKLEFGQTMTIGGEFIGEMASESQVIVGETAKINAAIKVRELIVKGEVRGTISHCELLQIHKGGRVIADIQVKTLDIKPGALFDGNCKMVTDHKKPQDVSK